MSDYLCNHALRVSIAAHCAFLTVSNAAIVFWQYALIKRIWRQLAIFSGNTRLYTSSNDRGNFNSVDRHHSMRFRSGTRRECQEGSEILPKWSQFDTHRVTQGMQSCFGCIVDGTEDVWHHLQQSTWSLRCRSVAAVLTPDTDPICTIVPLALRSSGRNV